MMVSFYLFLGILLSILVEVAAYSTEPPGHREIWPRLPVGISSQTDGVHPSKITSKPSSPFVDPLISRSSFFTSAAFAALVLSSSTAARATTEREFETEQTMSTSTAATAAKAGIGTPEHFSHLPSVTTSALETSSLQESISGFVAGGALAATKTLVKYPLDTVTVRLQMPSSEYSLADLGSLFRGSYNGVTLSLLSNIPGGAVFFAVKDATKASLKSSEWMSVAPKWVTTTLAVGAALIPYWLVRNPSEVIKVRQQAGITGYGDGVSALDAVRLTFNDTRANHGSTVSGIPAFYTGYWENVIYGLPADVIKFVAYEALTGGRRDLSPLEGAWAGAFATVRICGFVEPNPSSMMPFSHVNSFQLFPKRRVHSSSQHH